MFKNIKMLGLLFFFVTGILKANSYFTEIINNTDQFLHINYGTSTNAEVLSGISLKTGTPLKPLPEFIGGSNVTLPKRSKITLCDAYIESISLALGFDADVPKTISNNITIRQSNDKSGLYQQGIRQVGPVPDYEFLPSIESEPIVDGERYTLQVDQISDEAYVSTNVKGYSGTKKFYLFNYGAFKISVAKSPLSPECPDPNEGICEGFSKADSIVPVVANRGVAYITEIINKTKENLTLAYPAPLGGHIGSCKSLKSDKDFEIRPVKDLPSWETLSPKARAVLCGAYIPNLKHDKDNSLLVSIAGVPYTRLFRDKEDVKKRDQFYGKEPVILTPFVEGETYTLSLEQKTDQIRDLSKAFVMSLEKNDLPAACA